jgi:PRC-barrel domain protein
MLPLTLKLRLLDEASALDPGDDSYGLLRCQGFAVYDQDGRVGTVRHVEFGQSPNRSNALIVRTGLFIRRTVRIPTTEIGEIAAPQRRIVLRSQPGRGSEGAFHCRRSDGARA